MYFWRTNRVNSSFFSPIFGMIKTDEDRSMKGPQSMMRSIDRLRMQEFWRHGLSGLINTWIPTIPQSSSWACLHFISSNTISTSEVFSFFFLFWLQLSGLGILPRIICIALYSALFQPSKSVFNDLDSPTLSYRSKCFIIIVRKFQQIWTLI